MPKQQQSRSKTAYRGFIGYTAKMIQFYEGASASSSEEIHSILAEARIAITETQEEIFDGVLFSRTRDVDRWLTDFRLRTEYAIDKIRESLEEQLQRKLSDSEAQFRKAAAEFGTDADTFAQFLTIFPNYTIGKTGHKDERKTSYSNLQDVINVYSKIAAFVKNVRFDGRYYHVEVAGSDLARARSRRTRRKKKTKTKVRF